jgi:hypothetical protein
MLVFKQLFTFLKACCSIKGTHLFNPDRLAGANSLNAAEGERAVEWMMGTSEENRPEKVDPFWLNIFAYLPGANVIKLFCP